MSRKNPILRKLAVCLAAANVSADRGLTPRASNSRSAVSISYGGQQLPWNSTVIIQVRWSGFVPRS